MAALTQFYGAACDIPPCPRKKAQFTNVLDPASDEAQARAAAARFEKMFGVKVNLDAPEPVPAHKQNVPEIEQLREQVEQARRDLAHAQQERRDEAQFKNVAAEFKQKFGIQFV